MFDQPRQLPARTASYAVSTADALDEILPVSRRMGPARVLAGNRLSVLPFHVQPYIQEFRLSDIGRNADRTLRGHPVTPRHAFDASYDDGRAGVGTRQHGGVQLRLCAVRPHLDAR